MNNDAGTDRHFLFLQGPHGPFFYRLGKMLRATGAQVCRVGFNAGDRAFWRNRANYIAFTGTTQDWPDRLTQILDDNDITDIVLYGDTRPVHAAAVIAAKARGLRIHVFEEGYLRPFWVTYERDGSNGNSQLMDMSVADIRHRLQQADLELPEVPGHWGEMRQHIFYGALYHWFVMARNQNYPNFAPHRAISVRQEFKLHLKRLALMPWHRIGRLIATRRIKRGGFPYHIGLLQLEHDASFTAHSSFTTMREFLRLVIEGFANGAPSHHHLVFKAHPLEDGRTPLKQDILRIGREFGVADRLHFVRGGKLATLLDHARSAVAINTTAAQQVLWRGIPLKAFGTAVYSKPEFVSDQPISRFFAAPMRPDVDAYRDFRLFLLETSQIPGGFYSTRGRQQLLRRMADMMLAQNTPYTARQKIGAASGQQLRLVK
ncbi:MAG: capsule biosynthesis protein CapA [Marinosulfonomonas sp.]|nr:capsule biosynthesis protein CapA [Marinosulfonomonas sp.]